MVLVYDLGGHDAYYYTSQFLHHNCSQNVVFLCQALGSNRYDVSHKWLQATLTRSPECIVIPVLTKADEVPFEEIPERVGKFTASMKLFLDKEIDILEMVQSYSKDSEDETHNQCKLETYQTLHTEFENRLFVISVKADHPCFEDTVKLTNYITNLSEQEKYQVQVPKLYEEFYRELGKIGAVIQVPAKINPTEDENKISKPKFIESSFPLTRKDEAYKNQKRTSTVVVQNRGQTKDEKIDNCKQQMTFDRESKSFQECSSSNNDFQLTRQSSSSPEICSVKLQQLQKEGKIILFNEAEKIFKTISEKYPGSCEDVNVCLKQFHSYGLCLWFQGHPHIERIIFNHFGFFKDLLSTVFHHEALELSFNDLHKDIRRQLFDNIEEKFIDCVQKVSDQGLVSKEILKVMLHRRHFDEEVETIIQLFQQLHIAHCHSAGTEPLLFIPYFVDQKEMPDRIKSMLPKLSVCSKDELALNFQLKGNIPSTFWHHLCVLLLDELYDPSGTQERIVFKNGLWAQVDSLRLFVQLLGNILKVVIRGKADHKDVHKVWNLTDCIRKILINLIKISWPGLAARLLLDCGDCWLEKLDVHRIHQWLLVKMLETENDVKYVGCRMNTGKPIPSLLVRPPSKGIYCKSNKAIHCI